MATAFRIRPAAGRVPARRRRVFDPSDPYQWAHGLAAKIRGSVVLTRTGDGHTSYHMSECARTATDQYLIRPQAPADRLCEG